MLVNSSALLDDGRQTGLESEVAILASQTSSESPTWRGLSSKPTAARELPPSNPAGFMQV